MASLETVQANSRSMELMTSPRISFSVDFLDGKNFVPMSPKSETQKNLDTEQEKGCNIDFEFLSSNSGNSAVNTMLTADELFYGGKLLPFWQVQHSEKLNKISLKPKKLDDDEEEEEEEEEKLEENKEESRVSWFIDDDPSPRPPKCTVLWKELLKLKKQKASSLTPSSSTSSGSLADKCPKDNGKEGKKGLWNGEKHVKRIKKGLERTRSASIRIRPVVQVPPCTQGKNSASPPLFSVKKASLER